MPTRSRRLGPRQTCLLHPDREAAALCMGCGQAFCRECVTEHDLRMLCADCLAREAAALRAKPRKRRSLVPYTLLQALAGLFLLWFTAYLAGRVLLATPSDFHEGTVWKSLLHD